MTFKAGESGNPSGRPKGSRNKLGEAFLEALVADFNTIDPTTGQTNGSIAIVRVRADDPSTYCRVLSTILPKEITGADGGAIKIEDTRPDILDLIAVMPAIEEK